MKSPVSSDRLPDTTDAERRQAGKEASVLAVLLAEDPDDEALKARISAWCAQSSVHQEVWDRTQRTYRMIGGSPARHDAEWPARAEAVRSPVAVPAARSSRQPPQRRRAPKSRRRLVAVAAMAAAAAIAAVAVPPVLLRLDADMLTATAEVRLFTLEDGSRLFLGPRTAVKLAYGPDARGVRLLQGEAYFEVVPDTERPFRVAAGDTVTTVLGTEFEVGLKDGGTAVAVKGGRVRVDNARAWPPVSAQLASGDWLRVSSGAAVERRKREPGDVGDWTSGRFAARNLPIGDIVDRLRGYFAGTIILGDDAFANRLVNGVYDLADPETTLRNLASAHDAVVRRLSPWLLVVTAR